MRKHVIQGLVVAVGVALALAGPARAQAPNLGDFALRPAATSLPAAVTALGTRLRRAGVEQVLAGANRHATRNGGCKKSAFADIPRGSRWLCFDAQDTGSASHPGAVEWIPQGVSSTADAQETGTWRGHEALVVSWYDKRLAPKKGVRVTFLDPNTQRYRHVLLVYPTVGAHGNPSYEIVGRPQGGIHAGGILWYGNYLYVVDTTRGIRIFDVRSIFDLAKSPHGDARSTTRIGLRNGRYYGFGYRYVMPQVGAWVNAAGRDNDGDFTCSASGAPKFSSIAVDRSETPHRLVTSEYCDTRDHGRVARWPLDSGSGALTPGGDGLVHATDAERLPVFNIQGAVSFGGTWYLSRSLSSARPGELILSKPDTAPAGTLHVTATRRAAIGPEDLSYWPGRNEVWTVTEHAGRRMLYALRVA